MCPDGVNLGIACRLCGRPLLSCRDDGPAVSWHATGVGAVVCAELAAAGDELDAGIDALRGLAETGRRHFTDGEQSPDGLEDVLFVMVAPVCTEVVE